MTDQNTTLTFDGSPITIGPRFVSVALPSGPSVFLDRLSLDCTSLEITAMRRMDDLYSLNGITREEAARAVLCFRIADRHIARSGE